MGSIKYLHRGKVYKVNLVNQSESPLKILDGGIVKGIPLVPEDEGHIKVLVGGIVKAFQIASDWTEFIFMNRADYAGNKFAVYGVKGGDNVIGIYNITTSTWENIWTATIMPPFFIIGEYIYPYIAATKTLEKRELDSGFDLIGSVNIDAENVLFDHRLAEDRVYIYAGGKGISPTSRATLKKYDLNLNLVHSITDAATYFKFGGLGVGNFIMYGSNSGPPLTYYYYKYTTDLVYQSSYPRTPDYRQYYSSSGGQGHPGTGYHFHGNSTVLNSADGSIVTNIVDCNLAYSSAILSFSATQDYFSYISEDNTKIYIYNNAFVLQDIITI